MAVTTVPAAKAALLAAFAAESGLNGVTKTWGGPTETTDLAREHIWLGRVRRDTEFVNLGAQKVEEEYTVEVVIQVRQPGDQEQTCETRLWVLHGAVETAIRSSLNLGGALGQPGWIELGETEQMNLPTPDEWVSRATLTVRCRARI